MVAARSSACVSRERSALVSRNAGSLPGRVPVMPDEVATIESQSPDVGSPEGETPAKSSKHSPGAAPGVDAEVPGDVTSGANPPTPPFHPKQRCRHDTGHGVGMAGMEPAVTLFTTPTLDETPVLATFVMMRWTPNLRRT